MILLSVDTSGSEGSLALARVEGQGVADLHQVTWQKKAMHSEIATVELQLLMDAAKLDLKQVTHFAVNVGPGSFTGLRVGISLAKTLAYALARPIVEVNSLECLAFTHGVQGESIFVASKSIQDNYFCAGFTVRADGLTARLNVQSLSEIDLKTAQAGFSKVLVEGVTKDFSARTQAKDLIALLARLQPARPFSSWNQIAPLYIRASEAEEKLKKRLLKPV